MATTTRSAAKQQKLEEQMSSLLKFMEELKTSEAEQARLLEECQTVLLDELRTSSQRHEEQLTEFAGEHERRLDSLTPDQLWNSRSC